MAKCIHKRQKFYCKECKNIGVGGNGICEHNKRKTRCKECKGGSICEHGKHRAICKDCKGGSICEHNNQKSLCKECDGVGICEHGKQRAICKECDGVGICEHMVQKYRCKKCKGSQICAHNKIKNICRECKGSSICQHDNVKSRCKDCNGGSICEHGKLRRQECIVCTPSLACQNCFHIYVGPKSRFRPYCFRCYCVLNPDVDIPRKYMMKEHHLRNELKKEFPDIRMIFNKKIGGGCSNRRPDVRIECLTHTLIIECDENQHKYTSCEEKRMMELFQDLGDRPLVMIRFNPDGYDDIRGCFKTTQMGYLYLNKKEWNKRLQILVQKIQKYKHSVPEQEIFIEKLFYNSI